MPTKDSTPIAFVVTEEEVYGTVERTITVKLGPHRFVDSEIAETVAGTAYGSEASALRMRKRYLELKQRGAVHFVGWYGTEFSLNYRRYSDGWSHADVKMPQTAGYLVECYELWSKLGKAITKQLGSSWDCWRDPEACIKALNKLGAKRAHNVITEDSYRECVILHVGMEAPLPRETAAQAEPSPEFTSVGIA